MVRVEFCKFVRVNLINLFTSGFFLPTITFYLNFLSFKYATYSFKTRQGHSYLLFVSIIVFEFIIATFLTCQASTCSCICKSPSFKVVLNSNNCNNLCDQSSLADGECGGQGYVSLYEKCKYFKMLFILPFCYITTNTLTIKCFAFKLLMANVSLIIYYALLL